MRGRLAAAALMVAGAALGGCAGHRGAATPSGPSSPAPGSWVEEAVSFPVGDMTVYATYRHQAGQGRRSPAALLIAGSGPTDRDGNNPALPGEAGTGKNLAQALSDDGVASLRYDKLGTGRTGAGPYAKDPTKITVGIFEDEAAGALNFLAGQPGVDRDRLMVIGHSEGALYAMLLATGPAGTAPPVHALGLVEPQSRRILDHVSAQIHAQADAAVAAGKLPAAQAADITAAVDRSIAEFRATGSVPPDEPAALKPIINAANAQALRQEDAIDPAATAAKLPRGMPVLVSCSDADTQITCADVDQLVTGLATAGTNTDYVHLTGVNHVLKEDASRSPAGYTQPLPFSTQLAAELASFVKQNLTTAGS